LMLHNPVFPYVIRIFAASSVILVTTIWSIAFLVCVFALNMRSVKSEFSNPTVPLA
jgi:hypothetical protein